MTGLDRERARERIRDSLSLNPRHPIHVDGLARDLSAALSELEKVEKERDENAAAYVKRIEHINAGWDQAADDRDRLAAEVSRLKAQLDKYQSRRDRAASL